MSFTKSLILILIFAAFTSALFIPRQFSPASAKVSFPNTTDPNVVDGGITLYQYTTGATNAAGQFNSGMYPEKQYTFRFLGGSCQSPGALIYDATNDIGPLLVFSNGGVAGWQFTSQNLHLTGSQGVTGGVFVVGVSDGKNYCTGVIRTS